MNYKLILHPNIEKDLQTFSNAQIRLIFKQFQKLKTSPQLGKPFGNKAGYNLSGCKKMYVDKKQIRIVYRIVEDEIIVEVIVIGKREDMKVYSIASDRLG
jgi:mRNA interferase RelE/StbE